MDFIVMEYRRKHHRCRYCKYYKVKLADPLMLRNSRMCEAKNKVLSDIKACYGGRFCSCFIPSDN